MIIVNTTDDDTTNSIRFLTTALILAFITAALTILAYTLGRDDVEELEAIKGTSNKECQTSEE